MRPNRVLIGYLRWFSGRFRPKRNGSKGLPRFSVPLLPVPHVGSPKMLEKGVSLILPLEIKNPRFLTQKNGLFQTIGKRSFSNRRNGFALLRYGGLTAAGGARARGIFRRTGRDGPRKPTARLGALPWPWAGSKRGTGGETRAGWPWPRPGAGREALACAVVGKPLRLFQPGGFIGAFSRVWWVATAAGVPCHLLF